MGGVWQAHRRWVAAVLLAHMPRGAELEDLLQDVAMQFVSGVGELRSAGALKSWLRTVAVNTARTAGRRQRVRHRARGVLADEVAVGVRGTCFVEERDGGVGGDGLGAGERAASRRALELALALPEAYREVLVLRAVRGMSYRQIADALDLPVTTVETRLVRARRMVQEAMSEEEAGGER